MLDSLARFVETDGAAAGMPTYAALLDRKAIVPSASGSYVAVEQGFFLDCFGRIVARVDPDERWYLMKYPDVAKAIEQGLVATARQHYVRFGFYEHRQPYKIDVDAGWYLETYPDVRIAVEKRQFATAQAHFDAPGFLEGGLPYSGFTLRVLNE
nr:hypothetical protein [uncultured Rhodopila sp.]